MWQYPAAGSKVVSLLQLLNAFPSFSKAHLHIEQDRPCDAWCASKTMKILDCKVPRLKAVVLRGFTKAHQWQAILSALQPLTPRLQSLRSEDGCWPAANLLPQLQQLSSLTKLHISSGQQLSRIGGSMVSCLASMTQLQDLKLIFRSAEGTAHVPLSFSPISALTSLTSLHVEYTGLKETSSAVCLTDPGTVAALTNLQRLSIKFIPTHQTLAALPNLPKLRELVLHQLTPVEVHQLKLLGLCTNLHSLSAQPVRWQDLPELGDLSRLQALELSLCPKLRRGNSEAVLAGMAVAKLLNCLPAVERLVFKGQAALQELQLQQIAGSCPKLRALDLCCLLPEGTQALHHFKRLQTLKLQPFSWGLWSSEPPMLLFPSLLPGGLTSLEALDVWCVPDSLRSDTVTLSTPNLQRLVLRSLSPCNRSLLLPDGELLQQLDTLKMTHSQLTSEHLYQVAAVRAYNLRRNRGKRSGMALQNSGGSSSSGVGVRNEEAEAAVASADAAVAGDGSSELDEHMSCLADLHVFAPADHAEDISSSSSSGDGSSSEECVDSVNPSSKGEMRRRSGGTVINASGRDSSEASSSGGRTASNCSILDLQLLRRLRLCSSNRAPDLRLASWLVFAMQFKHKLLLQLGLMVGVQDGFMGLRHLQGGLPYCNFDMLVDEMVSEVEDLSW